MPKAIMLIGPAFEDSELVYPYYRLQEAGFQVDLVGPEADTSYSGKHGVSMTSDMAAGAVNADEYDLLMIPGGQMPDNTRTNEDMVALVRSCFDNDLVVSCVCHGGQLLAEAGVIEGRTMTGWPSIRNELRLAGATVEDKEAVVDGALITARKPSDLPALMRETIRVASERIEGVESNGGGRREMATTQR